MKKPTPFNNISSVSIVVILLSLSSISISDCHNRQREYMDKSVKNRIVCIGDSLTACGGDNGRYTNWLAGSLQGCEIINKGINGDTLAGGRARFQKDDLEFMIKEAQKKNIKVVIAGVFGNMLDEKGNPIPKVRGTDDFGRQILEMERDLAGKYRCGHVENIQADLRDSKYWEDANHPNKAGNEFVARRLLPQIKTMLRKNE